MCAPQYSGATLSYYGFTQFKAGKSTKTVRGSSRYEFAEGELFIKHRGKKDKDDRDDKQDTTPRDFREYKLNKRLIRRKIFAFYHLPNKSKYFRLWTLTFPAGTPDHTAYSLLNNWLTRLRTELELKDYIWVAERQQNSTLHFHLIFAQYIDIKKANYYAKTAINNKIKKGEIHSPSGIYKDYNGVDVSKKCGSWFGIVRYVTKYITKNNTTCARLPYYCSQSISRLFTCIWIDDFTLNLHLKNQDLTLSSEPLFQTEYFSFYCADIQNYNIVFQNLFKINSYVYSQGD